MSVTSESISMTDLPHEWSKETEKQLFLLIMGHLVKDTFDITWKIGFNLLRAVHINFSVVYATKQTCQ